MHPDMQITIVKKNTCRSFLFMFHSLPTKTTEQSLFCLFINCTFTDSLVVNVILL